MGQVFKVYQFTNVASAQEFLGNIASAAQSAGWTIDKDAISGSGELYLHTGTSLYFSLKVFEALDVDGLYHLAVMGNTGYDPSKGYYDQPGRYTHLEYTNENDPDGSLGKFIFYTVAYDHRNSLSYWLLLPCQTQWVLVSPTSIYVAYDTSQRANEFKGSPTRVVPQLVFGGCDSYSDEVISFVLPTVFQGGHSGQADGKFAPMLLGLYYRLTSRTSTPEYYDDLSGGAGILFGGSNIIAQDWYKLDGVTADRTRLSISLTRDYGALRVGDDNQTSKGGINYQEALQWNNWCSRAVLIKPIITYKEVTATDEFVYPIGELPYYAGVHHPYYRAGEIATIGARSFMAFPIGYYDDGYGVFVEVEQ